MPRTIQADGRTITVPDDATDEEINQLVGPASTAKTIAEPGMLEPHGGAMDILRGAGAGLKNLVTHPIDSMFGMPNLGGMPGVAFGKAGEEAAKANSDAVEQNAESVRGMGKEMAAHPTFAAGGIIGPALLAGGISGGLAKGIPALTDLIPSRARAGSAFESLNANLSNHPVPLSSATLEPLQRIAEIGERSSNLPSPVMKFLQRTQATEPMTFPEARDYQGGLSDLSSMDIQSMPKRVKGALAQLNKGLYEDIHDAAARMGRGEDFDAAMKEYRQASGLKNTAKVAGKLALKGAGMYGGYTALKDLTGK